MTKIPKHGKNPDWISEYIPKELAESSLFRFEVQLQAIIGMVCRDCGHEYDHVVKKCTVDLGDGHICSCTKFRPIPKTVTVDLLPDLDLDYEILEDQMQNLPSQYAFWSAVYSETRLRVATEERKLKATRGVLTETVQRRAADEKIRLTADQVKVVVEAEESLAEADRRLQRAQMQCGKLFHMMEALKMKSELARSLAGFKRQEHERS